MSTTFAFIAPKFSEVDFVKEGKSLTEEELAAIENDTRGCYAPVLEETPQMIRRGAIYLNVGLAMIPEEEKANYRKALEVVCPRLVLAAETGALYFFLRAFEYNPWVSSSCIISGVRGCGVVPSAE